MKMNKMLLAGLLSLFLPVIAQADDCFAIKRDFKLALEGVEGDISALRGQPASPDQRESLQQALNLKSQLESDLLTALVGAGCVLPDDPTDTGNEDPPTTEPPAGSDPDVTDPPTTEPPVTDPDPDVETPPVGTPPTSGEGPDGCSHSEDKACLAQLDDYVRDLRALGLRNSDIVHKMRAKSAELGCGNYGNWRSHSAHNCKKVSRPPHHDKKKSSKKCAPKPKKCSKR